MTLAFKSEKTRATGTSAPILGTGMSALRAIVRTFLNRRAAYRVSDLPDYLLTDIGLKRDDVHEALNADWHDDPTFKLAMAASRRRRKL